jgi:hypothetical protein
MAHKPLASVLVNNFNYADYLGAAVESALAQTYEPLEVVVVDDGSTDGSRDVIASFGDRVRAVLQGNTGQAGALNAGAAAARGEILCFLDSDDAWRPEKVARVVTALDAHPEAGWLRHRLDVVDDAGARLGVAVPRFGGTRVQRPGPRASMEGRWPVPTSALVLRRRVAERVFPLPLTAPGAPGFAPVALRRDADWYVLMRATALGEALLSLDEVLGVYRRHLRQVHASTSEMEAILERLVALGGAAGGPFAEHLGRHVIPTSVFKHRAVLAALRGRPLLSRERLGAALEGVRRLPPLLAEGPGLFARQAAALAFGTLVPRLWAGKLAWHQGFVAREGGSAGHAP